MLTTIVNNERRTNNWNSFKEYMQEYRGWSVNEEDQLTSKYSLITISSIDIKKHKNEKWEAVLNISTDPNAPVTVNSVRQVVRGEIRPVPRQFIKPFDAPDYVIDYLEISPEYLINGCPVIGKDEPLNARQIPGYPLKDTRFRFIVEVPYTVKGLHFYCFVEGMTGDSGVFEDVEFPIIHSELDDILNNLADEGHLVWLENNEDE